ncbi:LOW QUALITY PROTEIN: uncharacterized protein LOC128372549 [Scomber scombrus]|uniref:non-specific serine/threonine protein kinase n=1 Tax=Scomber scombrus TaxID=13677 RepID=A0AAV1MXI8_SCOSC
MASGNYVAKLNEYAQKTRWNLNYEDLGSVGPEHAKVFTQRVILNGKVCPNGVGKTKKEAKQNAAENALKSLSKQQDPEDSTETSAATDHTRVNTTNYICWLNEYGQKNRVSIKPVESTRLGPDNATQCCRFVVGDKEYQNAYGKTAREAKEKAAMLVYDDVYGSKTVETADANYNSASGQQKEEPNQHLIDMCNKTRSLCVNSEDESNTETNFIGLVNHYCQKTKRSNTFIEERRCGPAHKPQFFYKLRIDKKEYDVGEGKTVQEARQKAAELAWSALQEQSDWDSTVSFKSTGSEDEFSVSSAALESQESSPQRFPMSTSDSIIFCNSSNPYSAQVSFRSTTSEDNASSKLSTPTSLESFSSSQSMSSGTGDSALFSESWSSKDQDAVKNKNIENGLNETSTQFEQDYDIIKCLGHGAFGCVFQARRKLLKKDFAVKVVRWQEKSLREVEELSDLHHPNIVRYYTFWRQKSGYKWDEDDDCYRAVGKRNSLFLYIEMEICDKTLEEWITKNTLQASKRREESLSIAQQVVSGVEYIHSKMLIHRDLKPSNIMFGLDEWKIGDFGLVTRDDDNDMVERTVDRGTPTYMAPEQKKGNYDRKVDIFALGLIYFELLWKLSTSSERAMIWPRVRSHKFPTEFSPAFPQESKLITSMLCEKPEDRPDSIKLKTELEKWAQILKTQNNMHQQNKTI